MMPHAVVEAEAAAGTESSPGLPRRLLVALDSSDHANAALREAIQWAAGTGAVLTGTHVYAAKLHDRRFRQMEGGLPERYRQEQELERQREVHDDLITRGLSIITDSYLDQAATACELRGLPFRRRSLEGKNYRELVREANSGAHDLLVMGALGLGAVAGSRIGSVCARTCRRTSIDTLVVRQPGRRLADGPIVVAVDGSDKSYGGLLTALELARRWQVPVKVVAAFDPYFHYVAFHRIAGVLSEQAGKVFRFKEQERLHEEVIDSGLAKIYDGHLAVARSIAGDQEVAVETELLAGKPHQAIEAFVRKTQPSLLVLGKLGIHADDELDIGGNAEQLLHGVECSVLLSMRGHQPDIERVATMTTSWTQEAEARMERVPNFVRNMARVAILRYAQEHGHSVITQKIVEEATAQLMPGHAQRAIGEIVAARDSGELARPTPVPDPMRWSAEATELLRQVADLSVRGNLAMRAQKRALQDGSALVEQQHILPFLQGSEAPAGQSVEVASVIAAPRWHSAALARLMRVPEGFMRERCRATIEEFARQRGHQEITLEAVEGGLTQARAQMEQSLGPAGAVSPEVPAERRGCPFGHQARPGAGTEAAPQPQPAHAVGILPWDDDARDSLARAPEAIRGVLVAEVESWARRHGRDRVDRATVQAVKDHGWAAGASGRGPTS